MFGYVRPALARLTPEQRQAYQALYCGLCHTLGQQYGPAGRFLLNFDFTFLAALLSAGGRTAERRCIASPLRRRPAVEPCYALVLAADLSVILSWHKLADAAADSAFPKREGCRAARGVLDRAYRRAAERRPAFAGHTQEEMDRLSALERQRCASLDEPADTFASLLGGIALELPDPLQRRIFSQLFYHLGRWIYLVDAVDDCREDAAAGRYNPVLLRFGADGGALREEDKAAMALTLDASIRQMAAAYELWDFGIWSPHIQSAVYEGLYRVGNAVLEGRFHADRRRGRLAGKKEQI